MGNGIGKGCRCFTGAGEMSRRHNDIAVVLPKPLEDDFGHSFYYVRPDPPCIANFSFSSSSSSSNFEDSTTTFRSISGASVSANTSTPLSTTLMDLYQYGSSAVGRSSSFASSTSFTSIPLQPLPRYSTSGMTPGSGPLDRGFMSGPMGGGFVSGPMDRGMDSGRIEKGRVSNNGGHEVIRAKSKKRTLIKIFKKLISRTISRCGHNRKFIVAPAKTGVSVKETDLEKKINGKYACESSGGGSSGYVSGKDCDGGDEGETEKKNLQWAQGKAGEDRVEVVISEEHGWVFVGIYDGFNGPDAPEYLVSNLYSAVHKELKGLFSNSVAEVDNNNSKNRTKGAGKQWEGSESSWKCECDTNKIELDRKLKRQLGRQGADGVSPINHTDVLNALSEALRKTEDAFLEITDKMVRENPELALMGSCVLVMLMKGQDVYLMNVGDSRAVLAQEAEVIRPGKTRQDLKRIHVETLRDPFSDCVGYEGFPHLTSRQITMDHSTYVEEEVERIKNDHPDDASAVVNDRVKGYLKVTRAFGAGFLKQPKWNDALLEMFKINYVGNSPYITCLPQLYHHRLGPRDRFLILSSDGLYQYFTNEQAVSRVEEFIALSPEGDPAQYLIEEVLFRAAEKYGLDFYELLDIPQGERRRYHDDVSIIVISLEGRIWRSSM